MIRWKVCMEGLGQPGAWVEEVEAHTVVMNVEDGLLTLRDEAGEPLFMAKMLMVRWVRRVTEETGGTGS